MFDRVLLTTDGSPLSLAAIPHAIRLIDRHRGAIRVVHVARAALDLPGQAVPLAGGETTPSSAPLTRAADAALHAGARTQVAAIRTALAGAGVRHVDTAVIEGEPGAAIVADARATRAEVVVMATHGRSGLARTLVGSVADHVLRELDDIPLVLVRPSREDETRFARADWATRALDPARLAPGGFGRVLVPVDGSELAMAVLPHVIRAVEPATTAIDLLMVISALPTEVDQLPAADERGARSPEQPDSFGDREAREWIERGRARLDAARDRLEAAGARQVATLIQGGIPERVIVEHAGRRGSELIAMATHGRSGLPRTLLGSVPDHVLRHVAGTPVLLIRPASGPA